MRKISDTFKVLSDETRLRIMLLLRQKELCVCELSDILELPQPKVSRHLAKLRDASYVDNFRHGQWVFYYLKDDNMFLLKILDCTYKEVDVDPILTKDREKLNSKQKNGELCQRPVNT